MTVQHVFDDWISVKNRPISGCLYQRASAKAYYLKAFLWRSMLRESETPRSQHGPGPTISVRLKTQPKPGVRTAPAHSSENAIRNEIHGREDLTGIEERISGSFERLSSENPRLGRAVQALIALVEALSKTVLTCVPEPPAEARSQAVALAKERYHRLIQSAVAAMSGNYRPVLDLFDHDSPR
jgi:hypothetical protein